MPGDYPPDGELEAHPWLDRGTSRLTDPGRADRVNRLNGVHRLNGDGLDGDPHDEEATWLDREAGPLVRSFALTGGRGHSGTAFDLLAYVVATASAPNVMWQTQPEHRTILAHATTPISLAELASAVDLPLGVVRVLLGDLVELEAIAVQEPAASGLLPDDNVLKAVINGLRTL